jgi:putative ABC transport system substrate-binding protein
MKRREFITLAGAAVAWPLAARPQQMKIRRLGVLSEGSISNHPTPSFRAFLEALREAGWIERAFEEIVEARCAAIAVIDGPVILEYKDQIHRLAAARRLPMFSQSSEFAAGGGLMSYGPNLLDLHRHAAIYVDRILRGAKPSELPVEQPTKFELMINLKTARTLGIEVPVALLARADEAIE